MKIQTSLEFLLILSIVASLSLAMVATYKQNLLAQNSLNLSPIPTQAAGLNFQTLQNPQVLVYLPSNSTVNASNMLEVTVFGCENGTVFLRFVSFTVNLALSNESIKVKNLNFSHVSFSPLQTGYNKVSVKYSFSCDSIDRYGSLNLTTYASIASSNHVTTNPLFAKISLRNETISYRLIDTTNLYPVSQFGHCTYSGPFGPSGIGNQCGSANGWEYSVFSNYCYQSSNYYTMTYCIMPQYSNSSIESINQLHSNLKYSFLLDLYYSNSNASAKIFQGQKSAIYLNGQQIGNATALNATNPYIYPSTSLLYDGKNFYFVDQILIDKYLQAKNSLYSTLNFYNKTMVSTDIQSSINAQILAYTSSLNSLLNSTSPINSTCQAKNSTYVCDSPVPFYYSILVNSTTIPFHNTTLNYQGSAIIVK